MIKKILFTLIIFKHHSFASGSRLLSFSIFSLILSISSCWIPNFLSFSQPDVFNMFISAYSVCLLSKTGYFKSMTSEELGLVIFKLLFITAGSFTALKIDYKIWIGPNSCSISAIVMSQIAYYIISWVYMISSPSSFERCALINFLAIGASLLNTKQVPSSNL